MKVPPKRKGNLRVNGFNLTRGFGLNESPSEKEGKCLELHQLGVDDAASMKVPPKRKGNCGVRFAAVDVAGASMKVPPKRKGNLSFHIV